jgi:uncharacterized protein (TIGR02099 family)
MLELAVLLAIAGAVLLLVLRYRILPEIELYHDRITAAASVALGRPLTIGKIEADWDGLRPRLLFTDVRILDGQGQVALSLPRLENTVAWTSLPTLELRFHTLRIDSPDLLVRRDAQGRWYVAGMALEAGSKTGQGEADWLLHQTGIEVRQGRITWQDDLRGAPPLSLEQVDLRIENRLGRHRFAISALPPQRLSSRLDVRGSFQGGSFGDMSDWRGELYTQLDYTDVREWKPWLTLPREIKRGKGALRLWLGFQQGRASSMEADVALAGVQARLSEELPQLDLKELRGRIGWRGLERGFEVSTRQLALKMRDGFELKPTDFHLRLLQGRGYLQPSGEIRANEIRFGAIVRLTNYLPLGEEIKRRLSEAQPSGRIAGLLAQWQGGTDDIVRYEVKARFDDLTMRRFGSLPGFSGLSGEVDGSESGGTLMLDSRKLRLDAPQLFAEAVEFDKLIARLGWQRNSRGLEIKLSNVELANADLAGTIYGSYQAEAEGPGSVDATVEMSRVAVRRTARYTPVPAVNQKTRDWLQAALQGGQANSFRVRLRGDLRDFPFVGEERGIFRLEARARGVVMEFAKGWPRLEDAPTHLVIQGNKLDIDAASATTAGARLRNIRVSIPDLLSHGLLLQVRGEAEDATQRFLDYIGKSPVNGYLDGFTEGVTARGDGRLNLQLDIPLTGAAAPVKVRGDYRFVNNDVDFGESIPLLRKVNGVLLFTESSVNAGDIGAQILGGPAHLMVLSEKGVLTTKARGKLDLDNLNKLSPHPLLRRVHGETDWSADIRVQKKLVDVTVDSELRGIASDLPAPLHKLADDGVPLRFEQKNINPRQQTLGLRYGALVDAKLLRQREAGGEWQIRRGLVAFGEAAALNGRDGIWIAGKLPQLSLEGWGGLGLDTGGDGVLPNVAGIDVTVDRLSGYGNTVSALDIKGSGRNGLFSLRLASRELNGDLIWQPQGNGKLLGRFSNAILGEGHGEPAQTAPVSADPEPVDNSTFPAVDVTVEKLSYKGRQLGRLELELNEAGGDVLLEKLRLTTPDGVLNMSGKWQAAPEQTQATLRLEIGDAGKILARAGYPDSLQDGSGTLEGDLRWTGAPGSFAYQKLNGTLRLDVGKGRFLKFDAGAGKLLGVLSLQSIPRRVSLDFTDVFSDGFQFDSINGNAHVVNGLLLTNDMKLSGPAAKVTMLGQVDTIRETQDLKVRVFPAIGDNVSLLSFAAGPVVGMGVLLTNKLLRDPLDKLVSFEYNVSGSWADPKVEKVGQTQPRPVPGGGE